MKIWWLTDSRRLSAERQAVETLAAEEGWFKLDRWCLLHRARLTALGTISAHGQGYPVRLVYPDQFPDVPAWVEPQEEARWSTHQYSAGTLCLELRPDNWVVTATGADVLRSAHNLLIVENPLGNGGKPAPSAHSVGELQTYDWGLNPVLIGTGCHDRIWCGDVREPRALRWTTTDDVWPILIHDAEDRLSARRPPGADINSGRVELSVFISSNPAPTSVRDRNDLIAAGGFDLMTSVQLASFATGVLLFAGGEEIIAFHLLSSGEPYPRRIFILPDEGGIRSGRTEVASAKQVAIVGAGSVGSKIAESLVRSGIYQLTIVDGDVFLPPNIERHALDWRDVGFRKVDALKRRLLHITPSVNIAVVCDNLNWQRSARTHEWQVGVVASCDVIIDATGDPATGLFLGAIADANHRTFVSVEVFEGGIGGLVATCLPERDPPFSVGRASFLAWCDEHGVEPPKGGSRRYEALAENGSPIVADDAAVTMTAGHAARVVLDILDGEPAPINSAWLLLGYAKAWLFDGHGHTIRLCVGERNAVGTSGDDPNATAFAMELLKESQDEYPTDAQSNS